MAKKMIRLNLPLHIGFFVYQYAKLRMLEFYYDFLLKFVHPSDFQMCEMDTDSAYLAISGNSLQDVIKEDMKELYFTGFLVKTLPPTEHTIKGLPGCLRWSGRAMVLLLSVVKRTTALAPRVR